MARSSASREVVLAVRVSMLESTAAAREESLRAAAAGFPFCALDRAALPNITYVYRVRAMATEAGRSLSDDAWRWCRQDQFAWFNFSSQSDGRWTELSGSRDLRCQSADSVEATDDKGKMHHCWGR
jgi:hypothetical protein